MTIDLKSVVSKQIPEFVRSDYPLFVEFIQAYYEYLDQYEKRDLESIRDIDETLDSYVQYFKGELDVLGPKYNDIDARLFLRKSKQLFTAKGTEQSYDLLFKMMYGKEASIWYPWDQVLKASDGKWQQDYSIFLKLTAGDPTQLPGNYIYLIGDNVRIRAFVTRVAKITDDVYEIFIDKMYYGNIKVGYTLQFNGVNLGHLLTTTSKYTIVKKGSGYQIGDLIYGNMIGKDGIITQLLKITRVDSDGGIVAFDTLHFGYNYTKDFYLMDASPRSNKITTDGSSVTVVKDSVKQYGIPDSTTIEKYVDYGNIIQPDYSEIEYDDLDYAASLLQQFYNETKTKLGTSPDYALIYFTLGAVAKYPGYYSTNDGFLDDEIYIQDSYKWQKYSYVVDVDESLDKYKTILKSYLHPAGTELFGEYNISQDTLVNIDITNTTQIVDQWESNIIYNTVQASVPSDYFGFTDNGGSIEHRDAEDQLLNTIYFYSNGLGVIDPVGSIYVRGSAPRTRPAAISLPIGDIVTGGEAIYWPSIVQTYASSGIIETDGLASICIIKAPRRVIGSKITANGVAEVSRDIVFNPAGGINTSGASTTRWNTISVLSSTGAIITGGEASYSKSRGIYISGTITVSGEAATTNV